MNFIIKNLICFNPISTLFRPYFDPRGLGADHFDFGVLISVSCIIRGSLNTIRITLQNITAERDQYQNLLHDSIQRVDNLRNQLNDSGNQNLRLQRLLDESRTQAERIIQIHTDVLNNEMEACREYWQLAQNKQECIGKLLRENFVCRLLIQRKDTQIAEHRSKDDAAIL